MFVGALKVALYWPGTHARTCKWLSSLQNQSTESILESVTAPLPENYVVYCIRYQRMRSIKLVLCRLRSRCRKREVSWSAAWAAPPIKGYHSVEASTAPRAEARVWFGRACVGLLKCPRHPTTTGTQQLHLASDPSR